MLARSYNSHRDQDNDGNTIVALCRRLSKVQLSHTSGYKGQRHRTGTAGSTATSSTYPTGSRSKVVADNDGKAQGFDFPSRGRQKQNRKRPGDDDDPTHPNKYPIHDEEDSVQGFLCPFYVKDRYPLHPCFNRMFRRTSDVRQHLLRSHIQAPHCPRCGMTFDNDESDDRRHRHIREARCQNQQFFIPGITADQWDHITALANRRRRARPRAVERWMMMWRVIYPGVADPESPYHPGETDLIQGMLDIRAAIINDQSQAISSVASFTSFQQHEMLVIEAYIGAARQLQHGQHGATRPIPSSQTLSSAPASIQVAQGQNFSAPLPTSTQHPATQVGSHGLPFLDTSTLPQNQVPAPVEQLPAENPTWPYMNQPAEEFGWDNLYEADYFPWN